MKTTILSIFLFICAITQAQTKVISHKSHSGSSSSFAKAYQNNLFDIGHSNFGTPPESRKIIVLDTVIALNNSLTILKFRESIKSYPNGVNYKHLKKSDFRFKTKMIKDSLFNGKNSVTVIKLAPEYRYPMYFANPIEGVIFIGFKKPF
ncbi:hypothetical protein OD917_09410 [Flavobacterium sp. SH_e]|uniref:hypothetical protein n=1 Tax=Flavobacterium TaxID=237 RepID=UPI0021E37F48|nr:hypothetical protein [Flavobacterium sp. SH_e]MCV2485139.1 hypothetical protein [Flavobacterium sp. SH_e]